MIQIGIRYNYDIRVFPFLAACSHKEVREVMDLGLLFGEEREEEVGPDLLK